MYSSQKSRETSANYAAPKFLLLDISEINVICLSDGVELSDLTEVQETW